MHRTAQILIGVYLAIILITWPVTLAVWKMAFGGTWREANREVWARFNELRLDPYKL